MTIQKSEFQTIEFLRKVRDEQATILANKSREEIIAFFSSFHKSPKPCQLTIELKEHQHVPTN